MNSPWAISSDVLPSPTTLGVEENQPPGKNREEAVDSSLFVGDTFSAVVTSAFAGSSPSSRRGA